MEGDSATRTVEGWVDLETGMESLTKIHIPVPARNKYLSRPQPVTVRNELLWLSERMKQKYNETAWTTVSLKASKAKW